jgi:hypothetical protein
VDGNYPRKPHCLGGREAARSATTLGKPIGVLMLPATVNKRVEALRNLSRQGKRINGLYRLMESPDLWLRAYAKVYANNGATTKGVDPITMDGFAIERVENLITDGSLIFLLTY